MLSTVSNITVKALATSSLSFVRYSSSTSFSRIKQLYECTRELNLTGIKSVLPAYVFVGLQSAGKTSLISKITGLPTNVFVTGDNMATKRPLQMMLTPSYDEQTWVKFSNGEPIYDLEKVGKIIYEKNMGAVMDVPIETEISSPWISHPLLIIDTPGVYFAAKNTKDRIEMNLIQEMVKNYVSNPNLKKIVVMSATNDRAVSQALGFVYEQNQEHNSMGIITKMDLLSNRLDAPDYIKQILSDSNYNLKYGTMGIGNLDKINMEDHDLSEKDFCKNMKISKKLIYGRNGISNVLAETQEKDLQLIYPELRKIADTMYNKTKKSKDSLQQLSGAGGNEINIIANSLNDAIESLYKSSPKRKELEVLIRKICKDYFANEYKKEFEIQVNKFYPDIKVTNEISQAIDNKNLYDNYANSNDYSRKILNMYGLNKNDNLDWNNELIYGSVIVDSTNELLYKYSIKELNQGVSPSFIKYVNPLEGAYEKRDKWVKFNEAILNGLISKKVPEKIVNKALEEFKSFNEKIIGDDNEIGIALFDHLYNKTNGLISKNRIIDNIEQNFRMEYSPQASLTKMNHVTLQLINQHLDKDYYEYRGFFEDDVYPLYIEKWSLLWVKSYGEVSSENLNNSIFRFVRNAVIAPFIRDILEASLKFVQNKEFHSDEIEQKILLIEKLKNIIDESQQVNLVEPSKDSHSNEINSKKLRNATIYL
ncbi:MAG: hypothetical protein CMF62_03945 [Magnetococcales bacterium]|nr:hypothetical protein [Magnetococcales bacterium]